MSLQFRFAANEEEDDDEELFGTGFRFGSCLVCVTSSSKRVLSSRLLMLTDQATGTSRSLNVHTRLISLEEEEDERENNLIAMLLDQEEEKIFHDLSRHFTLHARVGDKVSVRRDNSWAYGEIIDRERSRGNFHYLISLGSGREFEGAPVFMDDDLIGVLVRSGPGVATVVGLEPITTRASPRSFFDEHRQSSSYREAYQSLVPESRTRHDFIRERLSKMKLFVDDQDFEMS